MIKLDKSIVREKIERRINDDIASGRVGGAQVIVKQDGEVMRLLMYSTGIHLPA